MDNIYLSSKKIKSVKYDKKACLLEVDFVDGSVYIYKDVNRSVFTSFISSKNPDSYFKYNIQDVCPKMHVV